MTYRTDIAKHLRTIRTLARKAQHSDDPMEVIDALDAVAADLKIALRSAEDWFQQRIDAQGKQ